LSSDYTLTSRMRMMTSALTSTASGSFLVGNPHITSANAIASPVYGRPATLPEPDWSLIHQFLYQVEYSLIRDRLVDRDKVQI
jgi:hypothetical protein